MKKYCLLFLMLLLSFHFAVSQETADVAIEWRDDLVGFQRTGMVVLGSWAVGNIAVSGYRMSQTRDASYHFHQMNVFWNTVNLGIALGGYFGAPSLEASLTSYEMLDEYHRFSKILVFNTGLDVAYVMTGLYLRERSGNVKKHAQRLKGYGNSLLLQGGFLFAFDLVLVLLNETSIRDMMTSGHFQMALTPVGAGMRLVF
jgi:hypothetical protein